MISIEKYNYVDLETSGSRVRKKGGFINDFKSEYNNGSMMSVHLLHARYVCEFLDSMWSLN